MVLGERTVLLVCVKTGRGNQIYMIGTMIETRSETDLMINAGSRGEIAMVPLAILAGHLGDVTGIVLVEVGGIQEMRGMKEVIGGAGIPGGEEESKIETGIVRESVIEIVTETSQGVAMTTIGGGQEMKRGMEGEDGEEEEIGPGRREVGVVVVVTVMIGGEGEGIVMVIETDTMIVSKSKTETGMPGGEVEVIATVTVIRVMAGGEVEIVTVIKNVIDEGGTGTGIKTEIGTVAGEVEIGTKIEREGEEIEME